MRVTNWADALVTAAAGAGVGDGNETLGADEVAAVDGESAAPTAIFMTG